MLIKVHTKKSSHRNDGEAWRRDLYDQLLGEKAIIQSLGHLDKNPQIGIMGPTGHIVPMKYYWGSNASRVVELSARLGVTPQVLDALTFVAGSMFFARGESPASAPEPGIARQGV